MPDDLFKKVPNYGKIYFGTAKVHLYQWPFIWSIFFVVCDVRAFDLKKVDDFESRTTNPLLLRLRVSSNVSASPEWSIRPDSVTALNRTWASTVVATLPFTPFPSRINRFRQVNLFFITSHFFVHIWAKLLTTHSDELIVVPWDFFRYGGRTCLPGLPFFWTWQPWCLLFT